MTSPTPVQAEPPPLLPTPIVIEEKQEKIVENVYCSCVLTARYLGAKLPRGNAWDLKKNSHPVIGGVIILKYNTYHIAVITGFTDDGFLIKEGNYQRCKFTKREIKFEDEHIVGFWSENVVK